MSYITDHAISRGFTILPRITELLSVARERRALSKLDADRLADVGLTREEADIEANRPIWDVPSHWTR